MQPRTARTQPGSSLRTRHSLVAPNNEAQNFQVALHQHILAEGCAQALKVALHIDSPARGERDRGRPAAAAQSGGSGHQQVAACGTRGGGPTCSTVGKEQRSELSARVEYTSVHTLTALTHATGAGR